MNKKSFYIISFLIILLSVSLSIYFFMPKKDILIHEELKLKSEILSKERGNYVLDGLLTENKIKEGGYITVEVTMSDFFINPPVEIENIKVFVLDDAEFLLCDGISYEEIKKINSSDLELFDNISVFTDISTEKIYDVELTTILIKKYKNSTE